MAKWKIGNVELDNQVVVAPMAGISNTAFRKIIKGYGPGLIYAEMVSTNGLLYDNKKTTKMLETFEEEHPITMQIFGGDKEVMRQGALLVEQNCDADIIDINFGCPAGKVNRSGGGAKWMLDLEGAKEAVETIVKAVNKPVTVKFRLGWDEKHINVVEFAKAMEEAGACAIAVHGRTRSQMYEGKARWEYIKQVKEAVSIPVIGNGDIRTPQDAKRMLEETGCDAVMIGRGTLGNPYLIKQCVEYLETGVELPPLSVHERFEDCLQQARLLLEIRDERVAMSQMRSHALWYVKGIPGNHRVKDRLARIESYEELKSILEEYEQYLEERSKEIGE